MRYHAWVKSLRFLLAVALGLALLPSAPAQEGKTAPPARGVVLFIGDGLGLSLIAATRAWAVGADGRLEMEKLPHTALVHTRSADAAITDSAAGASAYADGFKVPNLSLNVCADGSRPPLISFLARKAGKGVGIVTNTRLTDATPAAFYGWSEKRQDETSLASQLAEADFQVVMGGGAAWFAPKEAAGSQRKDERDVLAEARAKGWHAISRAAELAGVRDDRDGRRWLGMFGPGDLDYVDARAGQPDQPSLTEMTLAALHRLQQEKEGFFLIVEGGMIDKACHHNWTSRALQETLEFDRTIGEVVRAVDDRTLVIVTADHETAHGSHTAADVLAAAKGPGAEEVHDVMDNTALFGIMRRALGL